MNVLIIPDKFKGTLTANAAAEAMALGWRQARPGDAIELLPMSDVGDGFGEVMGALLRAKIQKVKTVDAAHQRCVAHWWWEPKTKTAVIESANVIGLAKLPPGKFHPFELDTFGLGAVIRAVDGPLTEVRGLRPHETTYEGVAAHLPDVWIAVRASLRRVLDETTLAHVLSGKLPAAVRRMVEEPDAWLPR